MNNLLFFMTICGSVALCVYFCLKCLLKERLVSEFRYGLLLVVLFFYLFPTPLFKYDLMNLINCIPGQETLFWEHKNQESYFVDLDKLYSYDENGILFPEYSFAVILMFGIWLAIVLLVGMIKLKQYFQLRRSIEHLQRADISDYQMTSKQKKWIRRIKLDVKKERASEYAFTLGVLRPVIVLPDGLSCEDEKFILDHELAHIKRHDFLVLVLGIAAVLLHFFNPLVYLFFRELGIVQELCCDKKVMKKFSVDKIKAYGHLLINQAQKESNARVGRRFSDNNKKLLKERIYMMKNLKKGKKFVMLFSILGMLVVASLPVMAYTPPVILDPEICSGYESADWVQMTRGEPSILISEDENTFKQADTYILLENGEIITDYAAVIQPRACVHRYITGQQKEHTKNAKGGCTVTVYSVVACEKCNFVKSKEYVNAISYAVCPH